MPASSSLRASVGVVAASARARAAPSIVTARAQGLISSVRPAATAARTSRSPLAKGVSRNPSGSRSAATPASAAADNRSG